MRFRIALLCALAGSLVSGAPISVPSSGSPVSDVVPKASTAASGFGRADIMRALRRENATLSQAELRRIADAVLASSARYRIDPALVTAVLLVESGGRPLVRSPKGAIGLMQVMPHMTVGMEIAGNLTTIEKNVEAGCLILSDNIRRLGVEDGISAYFWGSEIRGGSYLRRVLEKRASVRSLSES